MLKEYRMALHQVPEIRFHEFKTKEYLYKQVKNSGAVIHEVGETGLLLYFDNQQEETIAFRTDIDALPVKEETSLFFTSKHKGYMHACGHDGHMTMLLGLTDFITRHIEELIYDTVLIYQPSEEISSSVQDVIQSGLLDKYGIQTVFGFRLWPGLARGEVFSRPGPLMARSSEIDTIIKDQSTHIASSEEGIDSLEAAIRFLRDVCDFDWQLPAEWNHLMKFSQVQGEMIRNVLAGGVIVSGSIRSYNSDIQNYLKRGLAHLAKRLRSAATISFHYSGGYPAVINRGGLYAALSGSNKLHELEDPVLQAENFSIYTQQYPCIFFLLSVGNTPASHDSTFDSDMDVLESGIEWYKTILLTENLLKKIDNNSEGERINNDEFIQSIQSQTLQNRSI